MCGLWYLPLQAAYAFALAQRAIHQAVTDLRNVDSWVAATINRRLTEQWAWETLSPLLRASAEVTEQQDSLRAVGNDN